MKSITIKQKLKFDKKIANTDMESSLNFNSNIKWIWENQLTSIPREIIKKTRSILMICGELKSA